MKDLKSARILIVDDEDRNIRLLEVLLHAEGYSTLSASNGHDALKITAIAQPDLIVLDIMMPGMDGFQTVAELKANPLTQPIPVIMLTALDDRASKLRALDAGAEEFLSKPIDRADLTIRVRNLLRLKEYGDFLTDHNRILETQVEQRTKQLESAYRDTVYTLVRAAEHKDEETGHHVRRISYYCRTLAQAMDLPVDFHDAIFQASPMHDIGKIGIPDNILLKPGKLMPDEFKQMQSHPMIGYNMLHSSKSMFIALAAEISLGHHEKFDGGGYPKGLSGKDIPLESRIVAVADVYDALTSVRPYKQAWTNDRALEYIVTHAGTHFDPDCVDSFVSQYSKVQLIQQQLQDTPVTSAIRVIQ